MDLAESKERKVGRSCRWDSLPPPKDLLLLGKHADHSENIAFNLDFFAQSGILLAEELLRGVVTEYDHVGATLLFLRSEESALVQIDVVHHRLLLGVAFKHGVGESLWPL